MCVIGDSFHDYLIALVVPNPKALSEQAIAQGKEGRDSKELCRDSEITKAFTRDIISYLTSKGLSKMEIPTKVKLCSEAWMPDNELVTAALKIRRTNIQKFYQNEIRSLYASGAMGKST